MTLEGGLMKFLNLADGLPTNPQIILNTHNPKTAIPHNSWTERSSHSEVMNAPNTNITSNQ